MKVTLEQKPKGGQARGCGRGPSGKRDQHAGRGGWAEAGRVEWPCGGRRDRLQVTLSEMGAVDGLGAETGGLTEAWKDHQLL